MIGAGGWPVPHRARALAGWPACRWPRFLVGATARTEDAKNRCHVDFAADDHEATIARLVSRSTSASVARHGSGAASLPAARASRSCRRHASSRRDRDRTGCSLGDDGRCRGAGPEVVEDVVEDVLVLGVSEGRAGVLDHGHVSRSSSEKCLTLSGIREPTKHLGVPFCSPQSAFGHLGLLDVLLDRLPGDLVHRPALPISLVAERLGLFFAQSQGHGHVQSEPPCQPRARWYHDATGALVVLVHDLAVATQWLPGQCGPVRNSLRSVLKAVSRLSERNGLQNCS